MGRCLLYIASAPTPGCLNDVQAWTATDVKFMRRRPEFQLVQRHTAPVCDVSIKANQSWSWWILLTTKSHTPRQWTLAASFSAQKPDVRRFLCPVWKRPCKMMFFFVVSVWLVVVTLTVQFHTGYKFDFVLSNKCWRCKLAASLKLDNTLHSLKWSYAVVSNGAGSFFQMRVTLHWQ